MHWLANTETVAILVFMVPQRYGTGTVYSKLFLVRILVKTADRRLISLSEFLSRKSRLYFVARLCIIEYAGICLLVRHNDEKNLTGSLYVVIFLKMYTDAGICLLVRHNDVKNFYGITIRNYFLNV